MSLKTASQNRVSNFTFTNSRTGGGGIGAGSVAITSIIVTDSNFNNLDDTAVATTNSYIKIVGTGFSSSANVFVSGSKVVSNNVTYVNSTELRVALPTASGLGNTNIFVFNPDNSGAIWAPGLLVSGTPDFTQTSYVTTTPLTVSVQLIATGDTPLTYELQSGSTLPAGLSLSSSGLISGSTVDGVYQFTVIVSDAQLQSFQFLITLTVTSTDEYFNRTVLAINGDSNSFVTDVSPNGFVATISGDTKPHTFSPYDTNWSNYFDGTGDYLSFAPGSAFAFGTGDFTVECWVYPTTTLAGTTSLYLIDARNSVQTSTWAFLTNGNGSASPMRLDWYTGSALITGSSNLIANIWNHCVYTRSGSTYGLFLNGTRSATGTDSTNYNVSPTTSYIGSRFSAENLLTGYLSNIRTVKGTAVYDPTQTTITIPTLPLTAIANTSLLTCQSNRIRDNSTNAFTITKAGDVKVTSFGPFTETDTTTGSGFFDGSGDYITIADNAALEPSNLDWTIEAWIYPTSNASNTYYAWFSKNGTGYGTFYFAQRNLGFYIFLSYTGSAWDVHGVNSNYSCGTMTLNAWNHVAITRSGQTVRGFLNGVLGTTITLSSAGVSLVDQANPLMLGAQSNGAEPVAGYMSNFRYVRGTSLYTSNFTPPTSQLTAVANTAVLTLKNFQSINNHTFIDESALRNNVTRNGNPSMGSFSPFSPAGWSNYFDGNGDYLSIPTTNSLMHQIGDWTYEGWIYWNSMPTTGYQNIFGQGAGGQSSFGLTAYNGSSWSAPYKFVVNQANVGNRITGTTTLVAGTWYHFAVVRNSGVITLYVNGTAEGTYSNSTNYDFGGNVFTIGNNSNGYISNFRFNRSAVYTSNFTPPTTALTTVANTSLLTCQSNRFIDNSTNNFSITRNGDTRVTNFSPFKPTTQYSLATHGGSAYFDGSDYLQTNSTDSGLITTGPFTIEVWIYPLSLNTSILTRFYWQTGDNGGWTLSTNSSGFIAFGYSNGVWNSTGGLTATSNPIKINEWSHIAITRDSSNTLRIFVNGLSSVTPITLAQSLDTVAVQQAAVQPRTFRVGVSGLGDGALSSYYTGYISSVKIQTGVAKYTANSTSTLQTFPNESGINYLSNMNTMGIVDITSRNVMETVGNVSLNSTKKFGTGSLAFDGSGDYIFSRALDIFTLSGDFTIEGWAYLNATGNYRLCTLGDSIGASGIEIYVSGSNWIVYSSGAARITGSGATRQTWIHIAVVRSGSTVTLYVNGTVSGSTWSSSSTFSGACYIGAEFYNGSVTADTNGYIDDLRITRFARYTANFTAPTLTFLTQ